MKSKPTYQELEKENEILRSEIAKQHMDKVKLMDHLTFQGVVIHEEGKIIDVNQALLQMSGYDYDELIEQNFIQLFIPPGHIAVIQKNMQKDYTAVYEIEAIKKDGTLIPVEIESKTVHYNQKDITIALVRDITHRKQTENIIKKLSTAVAQSANSIVITDIDGTIEYVNHAYTKISGYATNEVIGQNPRILNTGAQSKSFYKNMWNTILSGKTWKGKFHNKKKDGTYYWEQATISPVKNDKDKITHFVAVKENITELVDSENRLDTFINAIPDHVCYKDGNGKWLLANKAILKFFGLSDVEYLGKTDAELEKHTPKIYKEEFLNCAISDEQAWENKVLSKSIEIIPTVGGETKIYDLIKIPRFHADGSRKGLAVIGRDVTELKSREQELIKAKERAEESESKFRSIAENISEVFYLARADNSQIIYVNPAYEKIWGRTCQSLYDNPESFLDPVYPEDKAVVLTAFEKYKKGERLNLEYRILNNKGEIKWVHATTTPIKNAKGEIIQHVGTVVDISSAKNFEQTLSLLMTMAKTFINIPLENISNEIEKALGNMGKFVNADRAYIFDYDWEKQICKNTYEWCNEGITPEIENLQELPLDIMTWWVDAHKKGKKLTIYDVYALNKDNGLRKILEKQGIKSLITLPLMQSGKCVGFVGFDSVKKHHRYTQKEEEILTFFVEIMENIKIRKAQEDSLVLEKKRAEQSDKLKTEFINNMSHEIRTPMNGILGFASFLNEPDLTEEKKKHYISIIQNSGTQLMRIIDDILEISTLGTKQVKVVETQICLNDLLLEHFSIFNIKAQENKIPLYLKKGLSDEESMIFIDKTKLNKIISNLIENALKFTNTGFIEFGYVRKKSKLQIYVKDTGIGISPEKHKTIFERFSQAEKELSKNVGGLGLGLSIAKENAKLLNGKITLKSEKGKGTSFFVTIPYKPVNEKILKSSLNNDKGKIIQKEEKHTILIVEDGEVNYLYVEILLKNLKLNLEILHAKNGKEAVEICKKNDTIDLILMDIKMPIMNGFEATKLIKEFRPNLPVIAQTAYSTNEDKKQAFLAGCDDFISKPITKETLNKTIHKYLKIQE